MRPVKRVEIVMDLPQLNRIAVILERLGITGYSIIRHVSGKGGRGTRQDDELIGALENAYLLTACSAEQAQGVIDAIRPVLKAGGGVCLISDAMWVEH